MCCCHHAAYELLQETNASCTTPNSACKAVLTLLEYAYKTLYVYLLLQTVQGWPQTEYLGFSLSVMASKQLSRTVEVLPVLYYPG